MILVKVKYIIINISIASILPDVNEIRAKKSKIICSLNEYSNTNITVEKRLFSVFTVTVVFQISVMYTMRLIVIHVNSANISN